VNQLQFFPVAKDEEAFSWVLMLIILRPNYVRNTKKGQHSWAEDNKQFFCTQQIICNALPLQINHTTKTTKDFIMWFRLEKTCAYLRHVPRHDFSPSQIFLCSWLYCKLPDWLTLRLIIITFPQPSQKKQKTTPSNKLPIHITTPHHHQKLKW
jgi:hypothetical protein